jgi:HSP20 family protein
MANITRRGRPSIFNLRRDLDDVLDDFASPRGLRREIDRLWAEDLAPRSLWQELEQLFDDFVSPTPLRRRVGALFEPFDIIAPLGMGSRARGAMFVPDVELIERDNEYLVKVDIPGVRSEDVDVSMDDGNMLTIRGERREEQTRESRGYEYTERSYGSFTRSIELPRGIDASKIEAEFDNGVLQLHVPKTEQAMLRKIPVKVKIGQAREGRELGQGVGQSREASSEQPRVVSPGSQSNERRENRENRDNRENRENRAQANSR